MVARVPEQLSQEAAARIREGQDIDTSLARTAEAFRIAGAGGDGRPPGFIGPVIPTGVFYADEKVLQGTLERLNQQVPDPFADGRMRCRADGKVELQGSDGQWYLLSTMPPYGGALVSSWQGHHDFGNPDYAVILSASILLMGQVKAGQRSFCSPQAYQHVTFDRDGNAVIEIPAGAGPRPPYDKPNTDRPDDPSTAPRGAAAGSGAEFFAMALPGYSHAANSKYAGNMAAQAQFYIDPRTGMRTAVVDAVSISYDGKEPKARYGRLTVDDKNRPVLGPRPPNPEESCVDRRHPTVGPAPVTVRRK